MSLDTTGLITAVVLLLGVVLVALSASIIRRYINRFNEGEIKDLGRFVFLSMLALLGKLLTDFSILVLPLLLEDSLPIIQLLGIFGIIFVVLTAVFLIKVSVLIKKISELFGFKVD